MEWALAIPRLSALNRIKGDYKDYWIDSLTDVKELAEEQFGRINFTRLYFGQEFCEKALEPSKHIVQALKTAEKQNLEFTYVTPYVTETGLNRLKEVLTYLANERPRVEVVINDWGVLHWVTENHPTLTPILGRLMNKILRDLRIPKSLVNSVEGEVQRFQTSYLAGQGMQDLLERFKVRRVELDHPPQGLDSNLSDWGYRSSLYLPYGVITTGRICLMQSWGLEDRNKFKTSSGCDHKCQFYWLEMSGSTCQVHNNDDWDIMQKGNSIFYRQKEKFLRRALIQAQRAGVNRIVFQPNPI